MSLDHTVFTESCHYYDIFTYCFESNKSSSSWLLHFESLNRLYVPVPLLKFILLWIGHKSLI